METAVLAHDFHIYISTAAGTTLMMPAPARGLSVLLQVLLLISSRTAAA